MVLLTLGRWLPGLRKSPEKLAITAQPTTIDYTPKPGELVSTSQPIQTVENSIVDAVIEDPRNQKTKDDQTDKVLRYSGFWNLRSLKGYQTLGDEKIVIPTRDPAESANFRAKQLDNQVQAIMKRQEDTKDALEWTLVGGLAFTVGVVVVAASLFMNGILKLPAATAQEAPGIEKVQPDTVAQPQSVDLNQPEPARGPSFTGADQVPKAQYAFHATMLKAGKELLETRDELRESLGLPAIPKVDDNWYTLDGSPANPLNHSMSKQAVSSNTAAKTEAEKAEYILSEIIYPSLNYINYEMCFSELAPQKIANIAANIDLVDVNAKEVRKLLQDSKYPQLKTRIDAAIAYSQNLQTLKSSLPVNVPITTSNCSSAIKLSLN